MVPSLCLPRSWSGGEHTDKYCGIDARIIQADIPMQVRAGDSARCADLAKDLTARELLPGLNIDRREMAKHADHALTVIDKDGLAIEKVIAHQNHTTSSG